MHSADGHETIVFNGEIFNHLELRAELEARGHRFTTHTDTETVTASDQSVAWTFDKAAAKGRIHKNQAANKKSAIASRAASL